MGAGAMKYRYIIQCQQMQKENIIEVDDLHEFLKLLERYMIQFGPIDLLYNVGRV